MKKEKLQHLVVAGVTLLLSIIISLLIIKLCSMIITITLHMFIALSSNGEHIGTTDYVVYQKENILTLEVL